MIYEMRPAPRTVGDGYYATWETGGDYVTLLRTAGYPDAADQWAQEHAARDKPGDEHYTGD